MKIVHRDSARIFYGPKDIARLLGIHVSTLYRWEKEAGLTDKDIGTTKYLDWFISIYGVNQASLA